MANGGRVQVEVLGPLRVRADDGTDATPTGRLQRRLLAHLVLRRGRVLPADALAESLWPGALPEDPAGALQNHVSRLRAALPGIGIDAVGEGYRLDPSGFDLDVDRLEEMLTRSRAVDPGELTELLARWRGPAFPELEELEAGAMEASRLDELRLHARELLTEILLAQGDVTAATAEAAALARLEPLRERPRALLMTALAADGRRAEALRVYDDFRRLLSDELGVEPSPSLVGQHAELLDAGVTQPTLIRPSRLPVPVTSLVGREELLATTAERVEHGRLTTLVGPGGIGKTRLLLEVGHRLVSARPDRPVALAELAAVDDSSLAEAVAAALGIDPRPGTVLADRVAHVVGDEDAVLLLDNCEHVLLGAARLTQLLLERCPGLRVLATSRERLRIPGEQVQQVPVLDSDGGAGAAVELFVQRARDVVADFAPGESDRARIAEVVRRLDGLPLAIELAAARLHTHELDELAAGLDGRFSLLTTGPRGSPRHGSLRAAVSWSFDQLSAPLQRVFTDLSIFSGSFDAPAAAAVCALEPTAARAALTELVERSLVMRSADHRYELLETLRAFGREELTRAGRREEVAERHAMHQVSWCQDADRRLLGLREQWLPEVDAALPELRGALDWLLDHDRVEHAGRLVASLLDYAIMRLRVDVLCWSERVLAAEAESPGSVTSLVWVNAAYAAWMTGDVHLAGERAARALEVAEQAGGAVSGEVFTIQGSYALFEGRLEEAVGWYRRGVEAARAAADDAQVLMASATMLLPLGYAGDSASEPLAQELLAQVGEAPTAYAAYVWHCAGDAVLGSDVELARERFGTALRLAEASNASFVIGLAGASQASIDARRGDPESAARAYRRLITHWRRAGMWSTQWTMLRSIAGLLERRGQHHDAAVLEGAVRATDAGHSIFGADEVALDELARQLRSALGDAAYEEAHRRGAALDGDAAVEHALRAL